MSLFTGQYTPVQPPGYTFFPYLSCAAKMTPHQVEHALSHLPSPLQFLSYVFSLGNLLAGPAVEYVKYEEFVEHEGVSIFGHDTGKW